MPIVIVSTRPAATAAGLRRKGATRADGARFSLDAADEAGPEAPTAVAFVCPTALLRIQEAPDPGPADARRTALRRGDDLLDRLDELRLALLSGAVPPSRLNALADALAAEKAASRDPRLDDIIAEIELRCAVELAKLDRARRADVPQAAVPEAIYRS